MKTTETKYEKLELREQILKRPDTYIGETDKVRYNTWIYNEETMKMYKKEVNVSQGFIKIFDEILVNALDHSINDNTLTEIKVILDQDKNKILVHNNGHGIPIKIHPKEKIYIPELIFGNLLTSSNYDDTQDRVTGGRNGYGSKLTNIFSTEFIVKTVNDKKIYKQKFEKNMSITNKPEIKEYTKESYTSIQYSPDLKRFGMKTFEEDAYLILKTRVYESVAAINRPINIYLNGVKLKIKTFVDYIKLFNENVDNKIYYDKFEKKIKKINYIWEIGLFLNEGFSQISFVNGINTLEGGSHVKYVLDQITKTLGDEIEKKKKIKIKKEYIKDRIFLFVKATVINPKFSSQSKTTLTTTSKDLAYENIKYIVNNDFITKIYKTSGIVEDIVSYTSYQEDKKLAKQTDGKKTSNISVKKYRGAFKAGTKHSNECTLFLTEGDSALGFATTGISMIKKQDIYGSFPLRGKLLNVRTAKMDQLINNEEIKNLKKILGLQNGVKYENTNSLRYGSIAILADQDTDGIHIASLIINFFHYWFEDLLKIEGFIKIIRTPLIKVSQNNKLIKQFYMERDYKKWEEANKTSLNKYNIKYYKGLGTSKEKEIGEIFNNLQINTIKLIYNNKGEVDKYIILAFDDKKADDRKKWIQNHKPNELFDYSGNISYKDYIDKGLITFSIEDCYRSIPHIADGLKPSLRKILYTCIKKNYIKNEIKVAQLAAATSEITAYKHGEASLNQAIVTMAQDFVGTNNYPILKPNGNFGNRILGPSTAAQPRYIFTQLQDYILKIFNTTDFNIINYIVEENHQIEPEFYIPSIPTVLLNGIQGIGTGYSTFIPSYNPKDILANIKLFLAGHQMKEMTPWYKNFKGSIIKKSSNKYEVLGKFKISSNKLTITELPVGVWVSDYIDKVIDKYIDADKFGITKKQDNSSNQDVNIDIYFKTNKDLEILKKKKEYDILKDLKLIGQLSTNNLVLFDKDYKLKRYNNPEEIIKEFLLIRLNYNTKRKSYLLDHYNKDLIIFTNKIKFITQIIEKEIIIYKKKKIEIEEILVKNKYNKIDNTFDYLISMPISVFSYEKIQELINKEIEIKKLIKILSIKTEIDILNEDLEEVQKYL